MRIKRPNLEDFFKLPNPGLRAYFSHTVEGNEEIYYTPLGKKFDQKSLQAQWDKVLKRGIAKKYPTLYDYEQEMRAKVGPMSYQKPLSERLPKTVAVIKDAHKLVAIPLSDQAIDKTIKFFNRGGGKIRLRSKLNTVHNMRLSTNSGPWAFTKRRLVINETLEAELRFDVPNHQVYAVVNGKVYQLAAVYGWRGQEGGPTVDDQKQRDIDMASFLLNILELQYYQPFIEDMQKNHIIPAYISMDEVDKEVTELFRTKRPNDDVICTDFTAFDQHFNSVMQEASRKVHASKFSSKEEADYWLTNIFPAKFHLPIICSEEYAIFDPDIMESGSGGTNADECTAHKALQFQAAIDQGKELNQHSMAYGDDGILSFDDIDVDKVVETYTRRGLNVNKLKFYVSKHGCIVLRRWHSDDYVINGIMVGVYSTHRALGRLLYQERFYDPEFWGPEQVILRSLSILENCKWHPLFHEFVDFVKCRDKFGLGTKIPGFYKRLGKIAKKSTENITDFLGFTKTLQNAHQNIEKGIYEWEVVKYLMKSAR